LRRLCAAVRGRIDSKPRQEIEILSNLAQLGVRKRGKGSFKLL